MAADPKKRFPTPIRKLAPALGGYLGRNIRANHLEGFLEAYDHFSMFYFFVAAAVALF